MTKHEIREWVDELTDEEMGILHEILTQTLPSAPGRSDGIPVHPDFVYRMTGEWKGWDDFLGAEKPS